MVDGRNKCLLIFICLFISIFFLTGSGVPAAEKPPIKVGLLLPYTGTMPFRQREIMMERSYILMKLGGRQEDEPFNCLRKIMR